MRLIILVAIVFVAYMLIKGLLSGARKKPPAAPPLHHRHETMVRCEVCDLHILKTEALYSNDKYFCSNKHLKEYIGARHAK